QVAKPPVRVLRAPESREHPHRPQSPSVHRGIRAPRVGEFAGVAELVRVSPVFQVLGPVERLDGNAGKRLAADPPPPPGPGRWPGRSGAPTVDACDPPLRARTWVRSPCSDRARLGRHAALPASSNRRAMTSFWICDVPS